MKGIKIFLADGFEDIEALAVCDVLRRGGLDPQLVSIEPGRLEITSSHGVKVCADTLLEDIDCTHGDTTEHDFMIFPGGMPGSKRLAACGELVSLMNAHYSAGGSVAAICAAPGLVLGQLDTDWSGKDFSCFEGFQDSLTVKGANYLTEPAVRCGRIITGRSAGHAPAFGLEILKAVRPEKHDEVHYGLYLY